MTAMLRRLWRPGRRRSPPTAAQLFARAARRRRQGRTAEAARLVQAGLALDADNLTGHLLAAYLHLAARATEAARTEFSWILSRDPTHPRALLGLARVALEDGEVDACRELLTRALRLYPDFPEAQALLGAIAARAPAPTAPPPAGAPLERVKLPPLARALLALDAGGTVLAARPDGSRDRGERLARAISLAAAALATAGLGTPRRAMVELADETYVVRIGDGLTLALALPRTTPITQGLLEVNRLWATVGPGLTVGADSAPPARLPRGGARRVS